MYLFKTLDFLFLHKRTQFWKILDIRILFFVTLHKPQNEGEKDRLCYVRFGH